MHQEANIMFPPQSGTQFPHTIVIFKWDLKDTKLKLVLTCLGSLNITYGNGKQGCTDTSPFKILFSSKTRLSSSVRSVLWSKGRTYAHIQSNEGFPTMPQEIWQTKLFSNWIMFCCTEKCGLFSKWLWS